MSMFAATNSKHDGRSKPACEMYPDPSVAADVNTAQVFFPLQMLGRH